MAAARKISLSGKKKTSLADLDADVRGKLQQIASSVNAILRKDIQHRIDVATYLDSAYELLGRRFSLFDAFIRDSFPLSLRTAYRYLQFHKRFSQLDPNVLHRFDDDAIDKLCDSKTPAGAVADALKKVNGGDMVNGATVTKLIKARTVDSTKTTAAPAKKAPAVEAPLTSDTENRTESAAGPVVTMTNTGSETLVADTENRTDASDKPSVIHEPAPQPGTKIGAFDVNWHDLDIADEIKDTDLLTSEQESAEHNKQIEAFCRGMVRFFEKYLPQTPFMNDSNGRASSALQHLKGSVLGTIRSAKTKLCPACTEGVTPNGEECRYCRGHGHLPDLQATYVPDAARIR